MKIGIITQSLRVNYGGLLQNFALQYALKRLNYDVVTIDQPCANDSYTVILLSSIKTFILKCIGQGRKRKYPMDINRWYRARVTQHIEKFISKHINRSKQILSYTESEKYIIDNYIDALIVGSDQVWRPKYNLDIYHSFLDFSEKQNVKRLAYAVSFGVDEWEYSDEQTIRCAELVKLFNGVSVRENSGINLCKKYLNIDSKLVLDPTLLLSANDYNQLIKDETKTNKGIALYILDMNPEKEAFINEVSKILNKNVYRIGVEDEKGVLPSVESWIKGISDADLVITDSFHGCVFSIIYNKQFYSLGNANRGMSRFTSLFTMLDMHDRLLFSPFDANIIEENNLDWNKINLRIKDLREDSIKFITDNL